jgi:hypothetical protein
MSRGLRHAWRTRQWFDIPLGLLGLLLIGFGTAFLIFNASVDAPEGPYIDIVIVLFGGWMAVVRPLRRQAPGDQSNEGP